MSVGAVRPQRVREVHRHEEGTGLYVINKLIGRKRTLSNNPLITSPPPINSNGATRRDIVVKYHLDEAPTKAEKISCNEDSI